MTPTKNKINSFSINNTFMRIRIPLLAFLFISFFSCTEAEEPIIEDPITEDDKNPQLTVDGFTEIIETYADVSINIVDDSTVETKVVHEGEEIATSTEKQFDLSINPYVIPVGSTDFMVVSTDAKGNETSETYSVEIKHLLMNYGYTTFEKEVGFERWLFFNDLDGKELKVIHPEIGDQKIYTDEIILDTQVFFSKANYVAQGEGAFKNLFLQTYQVPLGKYREGLQGTTIQPAENEVDVQLNDVFYEAGWPQYFSQGPNYYTNTHDGDETFTNLTVSHDGTRPIFIIPFAYARNPVFDGKKENYRYAKISPELGNTSLALELESLIPAENNLKIDIPNHDAGSLFINRIAYENEQDWVDNRGHKTFEMFAQTDVITDYVDLPILLDFQLYNTSISYSKDGARYSAFGNDDRLIIEMPNWQASTEVNDSSIKVSSTDQEVDHYILAFNKTESAPDYSTRISMAWAYNFAIGDNEMQIILPRLSLPTVISDYLNTPFYDKTDDLVWNRITAIDYEKYSSYDEVMGWKIFDENQPLYIDNNTRQIITNNPNYTGKSTEQYHLNAGNINENEFQKRKEIINRQGNFNMFSQF